MGNIKGENEKLITARDVAETLNLSVETIWRYTRDEKIPFIELSNRQYRYRLPDVVAALSGNKIAKSKEMYQTRTQTEAKLQMETGKIYTYQDYLKLPEEPGYRFEVLEGMLIKEPSPNVIHQRVSRRLHRILEDYFWEFNPDGEVLCAPLDVTLGDFTVVQPDLIYLSGENNDIVKEVRIDGAPTLVVEIISPSSGRKDRLQKRGIYQKNMIPHYWLVDPEQRTLECFTLRDGVYALIAAGMDEEEIAHPEFPGLSIPLKILWEGK